LNYALNQIEITWKGEWNSYENENNKIPNSTVKEAKFKTLSGAKFKTLSGLNNGSKGK